MTYFQNPTDSEFQGNLLLSDRQYNVKFSIKGNSPNSSQLMQAWNVEPFNVSTNKTLTLNYSFDAGKTWTALAIDVSTTAVNTSAALANEIAGALTANSTFVALFAAQVTQDGQGRNYLQIRSIRAREKFKVYVSNGGADIPLRFNKRAGVGDIPSYFARHTIANVSTYQDSTGMLVQLDLTSTRDQQIVQEAGLSHVVGVSASTTATTLDTSPYMVGDSVVVFDGTTTLSTTIATITTNTSLILNNSWSGATGNANIVVLHADYELLRGRSGLFQFTINTVNGSNQVTQIIQFPAGAKAGDLAMKTTMSYTGTNSNPDKVYQVPYVLTATDVANHP